MSARRTELNLKFAKKCLANDKYKNWFCLNKPSEQISKTRSTDTNVLVPVQARTKTFLKSPLAYLTRLINEQQTK